MSNEQQSHLSIYDLKTIYAYPQIFDNHKYLTSGGAWHGHIPFAFWCMSALKPGTFVELGTQYGDSFFAFCQASYNVEGDCNTQLYAIDTWQGDGHTGLYGDEVYEKVCEYKEENYPDKVFLIKSTFAEALNLFPDKSIDLLHIDAYHTYDSTKENFEMYLPKLSNRAVVLFHDTVSNNPDFGVERFVSELNYPKIDFPHCFGLSVVCVGDDIPEPLDILLTKGKPIDRARFVNLFAMLGGMITAI